jgi:hypothetical protein
MAPSLDLDPIHEAGTDDGSRPPMSGDLPIDVQPSATMPTNEADAAAIEAPVAVLPMSSNNSVLISFWFYARIRSQAGRDTGPGPNSIFCGEAARR